MPDPTAIVPKPYASYPAYRQFTPGPQVSVPHMPPAVVVPQQIALGLPQAPAAPAPAPLGGPQPPVPGGPIRGPMGQPISTPQGYFNAPGLSSGLGLPQQSMMPTGLNGPAMAPPTPMMRPTLSLAQILSRFRS